MSPLVRAVIDAIQEAGDSGYQHAVEDRISFGVSVDPAKFELALRKHLAPLFTAGEFDKP